jgi:hypothetical protein
MKILYYVSSHGFGHISRSFEIILNLLEEGIDVTLTTSRISFLKGFTHKNLHLRNIVTDLGVSQKNSIDIDFHQTIQNIHEFRKSKNELLYQEIEYSKKCNFDAIISDSSSFPFIVSNQLNIPSFFIGNFTWDFIYKNYEDIDEIFISYANELRSEYQLCNEGLILPFSCPIDSISNKKYVGLVGRKPRMDRASIRKKLNFNESKKYFLFSFGAYGLKREDFQFKNLPENYEIIISNFPEFEGEKVRSIDNEYYPNLCHAVDCIVTKPGYGILSEAYYANTPIIYTNRGNFIEYKYLLSSMEKYHNSTYISQEDLFQMQLEDSFQKIQKTPKKIENLEDGFQNIIDLIRLSTRKN